MDAVFQRVLELSLSGGIIALVVLCLRPLLRSAPKRAVCLLWLIVVLRLLVPFEIRWEWSLQPEPVIPALPALTQPQTNYFDSGPEMQTVPRPLPDDAVEYPLQQPAQPQPTVTELLSAVWLTGAALLGIHGCISLLRLKRRVRNAVIFEEGVWICPGLDTAFVLGFFRPQIYLPVLTEQERQMVLLHERCHLRRGDHWWKLAAYAAVCVHWFNPMAWVTYVLLCRDMEMACDQETVKNMTNAQRRAYSEALLRCAAKRSGIAVCPVAFGEISVKARIKTVLNYKKPAFWVTAAALIAAVAVGVFFLTEPAKEPAGEEVMNGTEESQAQEQTLSAEEMRLAQKSWDAYTRLLSADALHMTMSLSNSAYSGVIVSGEVFYCGDDYCMELCNWETSEAVETQQVRLGGEQYLCTTQGAYHSGWQTHTGAFNGSPSQTLDRWDVSDVISAEERGTGILLTFDGEPDSLADTDYYTAEGYTIEFCFDGEDLREVRLEYDMTEEGVRGTDHCVETRTFPAASADAIRERIRQMHAEAQSPCTCSLERIRTAAPSHWQVAQKGFRNTEPAVITGRADAERVAAQELNREYSSAQVFYDPLEEGWLVSFALVGGGCQEVCLKADGTTCMTVTIPAGETRTAQDYGCRNTQHHHGSDQWHSDHGCEEQDHHHG